MAGAVAPNRDETLDYAHVRRAMLHIGPCGVSDDQFSRRRDAILGGQNG